MDLGSFVLPSPRVSQIKKTLESLSCKDLAGLCSRYGLLPAKRLGVGAAITRCLTGTIDGMWGSESFSY